VDDEEQVLLRRYWVTLIATYKLLRSAALVGTQHPADEDTLVSKSTATQAGTLMQ